MFNKCEEVVVVVVVVVLAVAVTTNYVKFEVLTAVVMKTSVFCHITPWSPFKVNQRFGGTWRSSGSKNNHSKKPA
jgi:hypothetical protein